MPSAPSASWVTECAACRHSNPARAHFCNVCGAPLQSPAAAAARAAHAPSAGAAPQAETDVAEPKGFMLHFNDDNTLAIAPRYTSPDPGGEAETSNPAAAPGGEGTASSTIHAAAARLGGMHFSLPAPTPKGPATAPASRANATWTGPTVAAAMLVLTALVGTGSYLLGRGTAPTATATPGYDAMQLATQATAATAAPALQGAAPLAGAQPLGMATAALPAAGGGNAVADSLAQAQQALAMSKANAAAGATVAPVAPALPAHQTA
ncbi:zinc ribbon domain-containing protein, partial [Azohydromonas lata]